MNTFDKDITETHINTFTPQLHPWAVSGKRRLRASSFPLTFYELMGPEQAIPKISGV